MEARHETIPPAYGIRILRSRRRERTVAEGAGGSGVRRDCGGAIEMISVESCNLAHPRYPVTIEDKGWVYGVWYCGTSWDRVRLHGQYPPGFLKRALSLFPQAKDILHCPSGTVMGPGVQVALVVD